MFVLSSVVVSTYSQFRLGLSNSARRSRDDSKVLSQRKHFLFSLPTESKQSGPTQYEILRLLVSRGKKKSVYATREKADETKITVQLSHQTDGSRRARLLPLQLPRASVLARQASAVVFENIREGKLWA